MSGEHLLQGTQMKYAFIAQQQQEFPVKVLCQALSVSESGYYAWRKRPRSRRKQEDALLTQEIHQVFEKNRKVYGSPRIHAEPRERGWHCGRKRIARLMREQGISARKPRRRVCTTDSWHDDPVADNRLKRDFQAAEPNQEWVGDITGVPTAQGWLYLEVIVDLCSRLVVGWAMSMHRDETLVENALLMALARRSPPKGLLHHTDRGSQYTSQRYRALLEQAGMQVSMSRRGNCYDNAPMESFFGSLKTECVDGQNYRTPEEARRAIFEYLEVFYNRQRKHSSLGFVSPVVYEQLLREFST